MTDILDAIAADYGVAATEKFYKGAFAAVPGMPKTTADFRRLAAAAPETAIENVASMAQMLEMQFTGPTHSAGAGMAPLLRRAGFDLIDTGRDVHQAEHWVRHPRGRGALRPRQSQQKNIFAARAPLPVTTRPDQRQE